MYRPNESMSYTVYTLFQCECNRYNATTEDAKSGNKYC